MRYQKLEAQEANWKWKYLLKKHREGENITKYTENSMIELKILAGNQKGQKPCRSQHTPDSQTETIVIISPQILSSTEKI